MLNKAFEFLRITDPQPCHEKVQARVKSATELVDQLAADKSELELLPFLQGVVAGFDNPVFKQDSPAVVALIKAIKNHASLPEDLTENALELRAVAAIVVGELLEKLTSEASSQSILAALAISSAELQPVPTDKHIRWMRETLQAIAQKGLTLQALQRRKRGTPTLDELLEEEDDEEADDVAVLAARHASVKKALLEAKKQADVDREEIEILWWMFSSFSDIEQKSFAKVQPALAAFVAGIELGKKSLLPPSPSATAMVEKVVESGRKAAGLAPITLKDMPGHWSAQAIASFVPANGKLDAAIAQCPSVLPLSWAARRVRENGATTKLGTEYTSQTGLPLDLSLSPSEWAAQVFRETILSRFLSDSKES